MDATPIQAATAVLASISLLAATACGSTAAGDVADAKALIEACASPVNSYVAIDGTTSSNVSTLSDGRKKAVAGELSQVAACGGRAKVVVFSSSSAATVTLFEGQIPLVGATGQARARRLGAAVEKVVEQIDSGFAAAVPVLDPGGSDPVAQLRLFSEWSSQVGSGQLRMLELTDGFQNVEVSIEQIVADPAAAAGVFPVPDLSGRQVTVAGIGEVAGPAPATTVVDALKALYMELCQRSGAARCTVVSETAKAGS